MRMNELKHNKEVGEGGSGGGHRCQNHLHKKGGITQGPEQLDLSLKSPS